MCEERVVWGIGGVADTDLGRGSHSPIPSHSYKSSPWAHWSLVQGEVISAWSSSFSSPGAQGGAAEAVQAADPKSGSCLGGS